MNFIKKVVNLRVSRRLAKVSHPVSKYNESLLANLSDLLQFVPLLIVLFLIFQCPVHNTHPTLHMQYSSTGLINVR